MIWDQGREPTICMQPDDDLSYGPSPLGPAVAGAAQDALQLNYQYLSDASTDLQLSQAFDGEKFLLPIVGEAAGAKDNERLFWQFVFMRHEAWNLRFVDQAPPPWTADEVIAKARFTNVYRLLDRGTQFLVSEVQEPASGYTPAAAWHTIVYRLFNRIETWQAIEPAMAARDMAALRSAIQRRLAVGDKLFTGAYMCVSLPRVYPNDRAADAVHFVVQAIQAANELASLASRGTADLEAYYRVVKSLNGMGEFLSYMVATDLAWPLASLGGRGLAPADVNSWVKAGPGCKKGLALLGTSGRQAAQAARMEEMRQNQRFYFGLYDLPFRFVRDAAGREVELSLLDVEHSLCEFQKYHRMLNGGHVKTVFDKLPPSTWRPKYLVCPAWKGGYGEK